MGISRKDFVKQCGELLQEAKPHLLKCELMTGKDIADIYKERGCLVEFYRKYEEAFAQEEFVTVFCENGYMYHINVEGNSLAAIAEEIFKRMVCK